MAISFDNVSFHYENEENIIENMNVTFPNTGFVIIMGKSGCGKSTLLSLISGVLKPCRGEIKGSDKDNIAFLFQSPLLLDYLTVEENIALPLLLKGFSINQLKSQITVTLSDVKLPHMEERNVKTLSGREQVRVSFARALIQQKEVLILDEVTGQLDENTSREIYKLLKELAKDHLILLVTHDQKNAPELADYLYEFQNKTIVLIQQNTKEIEKHNSPPKKAKKTKEVIGHKECALLLKRFLNKRRFRVYLSCIFLALETAFIYFGLIFNLNLNPFLKKLVYEHYAYDTIKIRKLEKVNTDSHLTLEHYMIPEEEVISALKIDTYYPSLNYFIPENTQLDYNEKNAAVTLIPFFTQNNTKAQTSCINTIVNELFLKEFNLNNDIYSYKQFLIQKETFFNIPDSDIHDIIRVNLPIKITAISKEKSLFNKPIIYYDYQQVKQIVSSQLLENYSKKDGTSHFLEEFLDVNQYRKFDFLCHELYLQNEDPLHFEKTVKSLYNDSIVIESNPLSIYKTTTEMSSLILRVITAFLVLNIISASVLEFLSVSSLYEDNLRFFALLNVFSATKKSKSRYLLHTTIQLFYRTFLLLILFIFLLSACTNITLSHLGFISFFQQHSLLYLSLISLILYFISCISAFLPLKRIQKEHIKKELEGED